MTVPFRSTGVRDRHPAEDPVRVARSGLQEPVSQSDQFGLAVWADPRYSGRESRDNQQELAIVQTYAMVLHMS